MESKTTGRKSYKKWLVRVGVILIVLMTLLFVLSPFIYRSLAGSLTDRTTSYSGFTYTYKFYKNAKPVMVKDVPGLSFNKTVTTIAFPTRDPLISSCLGVGSGWAEAFTVTLNGAERSVCEIESDKAHTYTTNFLVDGTTHSFTVAFNKLEGGGDGGDRALTSDTKSLQAIFRSVRVAK